MFDLDANIGAAHEVLRADPLLAASIRRRPGLRMPGGWDGFEVMIRAILGQQVTVKSATTLAKRLTEQYGEHCGNKIPGLDKMFPTPENLVNALMETIGLTKSRAMTIRSVAAAVLESRIDFRAGQRLDSFVETATALPGIGPWTANYVAMRALNHPDAFPAGDLVIQQVLGGNRRLSERETVARSQAWRPWRAYAAIHLWHLALKNRQGAKTPR